VLHGAYPQTTVLYPLVHGRWRVEFGIKMSQICTRQLAGTGGYKRVAAGYASSAGEIGAWHVP